MDPVSVSRRTVCALAIGTAASCLVPPALRKAAGAAAAARSQVIEDWHQHKVGSKGVPPGWQRYETPGGHPTYDFTIVADSGSPALDLRSTDDHSTIAKEVTVDLAATPVLEWQWKMISLPPGADLRRWKTSDAGGHIFVVWPRWPALLRSRLIGYVWDPILQPGAIVHSRKTRTVTFIIVRSGQEGIGQWATERRSIPGDYRAVFGEDPDNPRAIALSIDTNDTHSSAEARFGRIAFVTEAPPPPPRLPRAEANPGG